MNSRGFLNFKGNPLLSSNMLRVTETLPGQHVQRICLLCLAVSISDLGIDLNTYKGFLGDSVVKNLPANAGDVSSILVWGRSPGERDGNPLQYSCLENPMDRERSLEGYSPWGHKKSQTQLNDQTTITSYLPKTAAC